MLIFFWGKNRRLISDACNDPSYVLYKCFFYDMILIKILTIRILLHVKIV